jgi:hypothetical protein
VVLEAGAMMLWVIAPASDQEAKVLAPWGELVPMERVIPTTLKNVRGAVKGWPSRVMERPPGAVVRMRVVLFG